MSGTCGPTSGTHSQSCARWSPSLRTWTDTGLLDLPMSLGTLPKWGCLHGGELFELRMPGHVMGGQGCSSLPTPTARDYKDSEVRREPHRPDDTDTLSRALSDLLPTPRTSDTNGPEAHGTGGLDLRTAVSLLPTPTVMDMGSNYTPEEWEAWKQQQKTNHQNGNGHGASLYQEAISLLPTPSAQEPGHTGALVDKQGNPVDHVSQRCFHPQTGRLVQTGLPQAVALIGASTPLPSDAGSSSPGPHQHPLSQGSADDHDCLPLSWNG